MTSLDEATALDLKHWLDDEAPDSPPCDGLDEDGCGMEAVARAVWESACEHVDHETLLCALHQDELKTFLESGQILKCRHCRKLVRVQIWPLR